MGSSNSTEVGGVRVFKVSPGSPAYEAGLEVFFDFILEINGQIMDSNYQQSFTKTIQESENVVSKMKVYNLRAQCTREVAITPKKWPGSGLLGATVRYDVVDPAEHAAIRVLEVFPNSPAAHAGLVPFQDFLLGTAQSIFRDIDELVEVVTSNINQRMQVYVYNTDSETVREVVLVPNNDWGGEGCIGCDIGTGLLHRLPAPRRLPGSAPPTAMATPAFAAVTYPNGTGPAVPPLPPGVANPLASALTPVGVLPVATPSLPAGVAASPPIVNGYVTSAPPSAPVSAPPPPAASLPPATQAPAPAPAASASPAAASTSEAMAQLQAQISQLGKAPAAPPKPVVAGVSWPPKGQPEDDHTPDSTPPRTPDGTPSCRAPPSTPMNAADPATAVPQTDLSAALYPALSSAVPTAPVL